MPKTMKRIKGHSPAAHMRSVDMILDEILKNQIPLAHKQTQVIAERLNTEMNRLTALQVRLENLAATYERRLQELGNK